MNKIKDKIKSKAKEFGHIGKHPSPQHPPAPDPQELLQSPPFRRNSEIVGEYVREKQSRHQNVLDDGLLGLDFDDEAGDQQSTSSQALQSSISEQSIDSILNSIESKYFVPEEKFNALEDVLQRLPPLIDVNFLAEEKRRLKRQLIVVTKKVADLIEANQPQCNEGLTQVTSIQTQLSDTIKVCTRGRKALQLTMNDFTCSSLKVVASYQRKEVLRNLLSSLQTIKTLQQTDIRLRELLEDDADFPGAIRLCLECHKVLHSLRHYKCVSELNAKLSDTLEMIEEQIDVTLSKMANNFNMQTYQKLQTAYGLLGKTQTAADQLLMHFASAIHNSAFSVVLGYLQLFVGGSDQSWNKKPYKDICRSLPQTSECFLPCFVDLCKAMWTVMANYMRILHWHRVNEEWDSMDEGNQEQLVQQNITVRTANADHASKNEMGSGDASVAASVTDGPSVEAAFHRRYVKQKLENGLNRVWQEVNQQVKDLIDGQDLSDYSIDDFIRVLDIAKRIVDCGQEFCGHDAALQLSADLQESLHQKTLSRFQIYHRLRIEELKTFLENEIWTICPVKSSFKILHLHEFRFLISHTTNSSTRSSPFPSPSKPSAPHPSVYFSKSVVTGSSSSGRNPFDRLLLETEANANGEDEDVFMNEDEQDQDQAIEEEEEGHEDGLYHAGVRSYEGPIVTMTTLNVLRSFGKYMQMMHVLQPIAFDVLVCLFHLFDYYLYAIYHFFAREMVNLNEGSIGNRLKASLNRIQRDLIDLEQIGLAPSAGYDSHSMSSKSSSSTLDQISTDQQILEKFHCPQLSPMVDLNNAESLFGLSERIVAIESLVTLANQFSSLQQYLEPMIPNDRQSFLHQYFNQTVASASDLRRPVYMLVAVRCIDYEKVLNGMSSVRWDVREILSQHSPYVDHLLRELQIYSMRMQEVAKTRLRINPLPVQAHNLLWESVLRGVNRTFIEGFSRAKKCTNEGRALMQLDYQHFLSKIQQIVPHIKAQGVPERELVEEYIKSYYLQEVALENWIKDKLEANQYTAKQLEALVNCVIVDNRKARTRLINFIHSAIETRSLTDQVKTFSNQSNAPVALEGEEQAESSV